MRRLIFAVIAVAAAAAPAHARAAGCPPSTCGILSVPVPGSSLLALRPSGDRGPLLAYDLLRGRTRFSLPSGTLSPDGRRFFAARSATTATRITAYDGLRGTRLARWSIPGPWLLARTSANGRWLAFVRSGKGTTAFAVVDSTRHRLAYRFALASRYDVDAVSPDGRRLFLIQWFASNGPPKYAVRAYDLARAEMATVALKSSDSGMAGFAWGAVASPGGHRLLTLYLNISNGTAFVHDLDLRASYAMCVDLPDRSRDPSTLGNYTLVLSRDGRRLYAANPALGVVHELDVARGRLVSTARFAGTTPELNSNGAISRDGRTLAFASGSSVFTYDTVTAKVAAPRSIGAPVAGLGFDAKGRLVVVRSDRRAVTLKLR